MNFTTEYTILLSFIYLLFVSIAFAPKTCKVEPVEKSHLVNLPGEPVSLPTAIAPKTFLHGLSIRELKKLASIRKIPRYGSLNKQQLIFALT